eukprot:GILK01008694.1.p1 GENE.GILK01008694.1~~GILK01008694.1.p1  ORF type:complete len:226 (-),score=12.66 GILK01008694.1:230-907(-)
MFRFGANHLLRRFSAQAGEAQKANRGFLAWYNGHLAKRPVVTKMVTSTILFGGGDLFAQTLLKQDSASKAPFDFKRLLRACIYGGLLLGPLSHVHYNFLDWLVLKQLRVRSSFVPVAKVFFEQFTYWSPSMIVLYFASMGAMEGQSWHTIQERVRTSLWPTLCANWMLWPAVQLVNFKFVPVPHQLNFVLIVSLGWSCYLSLVAAQTSSTKLVKQELKAHDQTAA